MPRSYDQRCQISNEHICTNRNASFVVPGVAARIRMHVHPRPLSFPASPLPRFDRAGRDRDFRSDTSTGPGFVEAGKSGTAFFERHSAVVTRQQFVILLRVCWHRKDAETAAARGRGGPHRRTLRSGVPGLHSDWQPNPSIGRYPSSWRRHPSGIFGPITAVQIQSTNPSKQSQPKDTGYFRNRCHHTLGLLGPGDRHPATGRKAAGRQLVPPADPSPRFRQLKF